MLRKMRTSEADGFCSRLQIQINILIQFIAIQEQIASILFKKGQLNHFVFPKKESNASPFGLETYYEDW